MSAETEEDGLRRAAVSPHRASGSVGSRPQRSMPVLAAVACAFSLAQFLLVVPGLGLGWDETVYVSQVSGHSPAAFFSAPRARGITFLAAPVAAVTASTTALRVWLAVLSGCGLLLGLRVWRRLLPTPVVAGAGLLFAGLWVTVLYGPQAMPNLWVAFGAFAAVGCFLRAVRGSGDRRALLGLGGAVAFVALMRPMDAVWLTLALTGAAFVTSGRRPPHLLVVVLISGTALGGAEWVIEAVLRYGGLPERLRRASEIQGHLGWHFAVDDHLRALSGITLCRPCTVPWRHQPAGLWFLALPFLVVAGIRAARNNGYRAPIAMAAWAGAAMAAPYLFTVGYAAPRFLLPAYLLLAVPVAQLLVSALSTGRSDARRRRVTAALIATALAAHVAIQYLVLHAVVERVRADTSSLRHISAVLRAQGVHPPCVVSGDEAIRVAYHIGCSSRLLSGHDASITPGALAATAERMPVVVLVSGSGQPPGFAGSWRAQSFPGLGDRTPLRAYLSLTTQPRPTRPKAKVEQAAGTSTARNGANQLPCPCGFAVFTWPSSRLSSPHRRDGAPRTDLRHARRRRALP
ncbi:hypothetical protein ABZ934_28105 [Streptomyces sp. NPDC046557]|uniref:hypothetical protein n=1 Tax=Streptomyces sp. NPDC046557 TaxID=3155372 RepID=UPI0033CA6F53